MKKPEQTTHLSPVPNNPRDNQFYVDKEDKRQEDKFNKDNMLFDAAKRKFLNAIRKSRLEDRYGYRTSAGHWKNRDEPNTDGQERQADAISKMLQQKKVALSKDRLKAQNKVPIRSTTGKKLFEQFVQDAGMNRKENIDDAYMTNIYNAANHLIYEKWIWFVNNEYGNSIK